MSSTSVDRRISSRGKKGNRGGKDQPGKHTVRKGGEHGGGGKRGIFSGKEVSIHGNGGNGAQGVHGPSRECTLCEAETGKEKQEG